MKPRLVVVTSSPAEVVRCAGGWLFDRAMAGWEVLVLTAGGGDTRPLRILGTCAIDLETALALPIRGPRPHAIAVGADLFSAHGQVQDRVLRALEEGKAEVRFWGDPWPEELDPGVSPPVAHRLSVAARAFKTEALGAAACPTEICEATEMFRLTVSARSLGKA
ncbi:hypothetical protein E1200_01130 [Actinomadura sp. GC306]|uniref:hypothetical protein n=1 Tax=Actinomadura sp. GC306 TaxID=2530367 RepID=UPI00104438BE|nr:hypothetical protein [Actinomadura sp. GC306]TDC71839.1 hypothetical protein E1200_01130 [Actinomadura sp. GC306]